MSVSPAFLFEFLAFSGPAVAWGLWELWSLKREREKEAAAARSESTAPGHAEGE